MLILPIIPPPPPFFHLLCLLQEMVDRGTEDDSLFDWNMYSNFRSENLVTSAISYARVGKGSQVITINHFNFTYRIATGKPWRCYLHIMVTSYYPTGRKFPRSGYTVKYYFRVQIGHFIQLSWDHTPSSICVSSPDDRVILKIVPTVNECVFSLCSSEGRLVEWGQKQHRQVRDWVEHEVTRSGT